MTTPHTPPTQAELDEWKIRARDSAPGTSEVFFCLIAEVERLRAEVNVRPTHGDMRLLTKEVERLRTEHDCIAKNIPCGACAEQAFCGSAMYPHDETCPIARLTKEVEELRKDKRLSRCPFCLDDNFDSIGLKHHLLAGHCHPWNTTSSPWPAMQQKGEG